MPKINPLIAYWHSVDLPEVTEPLKEIPCDQVHISYFGYPYPHRIAELFFKAHKQYTHLLLIPNDLIVTKEHYYQLLEQIEKHDYPVLCGVCNVDTERHKDDLNVCLTLPEIPYFSSLTKKHRVYKWLAESQRQHLLQRVDTIQVKFAGFPFMWVRRDVLNNIRINWLESQTDESPIWETRGGYSNDLAFCHNLNKHNIPIMCYLPCKMLHLRYAGKQQLGIKSPIVRFIQYQPK